MRLSRFRRPTFRVKAPARAPSADAETASPRQWLQEIREELKTKRYELPSPPPWPNRNPAG